MHTNNIVLMSLVTISILLSGCGGGDSTDGTPTSAGTPKTSSSLIGSWEDTNTGRVNTYSDNNYTSHVSKVYSDLGYSYDATEYWVYSENGTKILQPNDRNVTKVDIERKSCVAHMTPNTVQTVSDFNNELKCSFSDWSLNTAKDVSNCTEALVQASCVTSSSKNIYFIENNKLYVGYTQYKEADGYPYVLKLTYMQRQ